MKLQSILADHAQKLTWEYHRFLDHPITCFYDYRVWINHFVFKGYYFVL